MTSRAKKVKTVEQARTLSLKKWVKVKKLHETLFGELDKNCGFCDLGRYRMKNRGPDSKVVMGCELCGVSDRCNEIHIEGSKLETRTRELIDNTIFFLEEMKVTESE